MRRGRAAVATTLALAGLVALPGAAATGMGMSGHGSGAPGHADAARDAAPGPLVSIAYNSFAPTRLDVLTGETVTFENDSARAHTVTADDNRFDSGRVTVGTSYRQAFAQPGDVAYHCSLHAGMNGVIGVHTLLLEQPGAAAAPGHAFPVEGRAALAPGTTVSLESDTGSGYTPAATATVAADGTFATTVTPRTSGTLRAVAAGTEASPAVTLKVLDRRVAFTSRTVRRGVSVTARVSPASPGATVVLQLFLPERFGWWPVQQLELDGRSQATVVQPLHRRVAARVVLTLPDGATPLASSPVRRIGVRRAAPASHPGH